MGLDTSFALYKQIITEFPNNQLAADGSNSRPIQVLGARKLYYIGTPSNVFDSSASAKSGTSLDSTVSSSASWDQDSSGSEKSLGSNISGSSGAYMAVWKWIALLILLACCCIGGLAALMREK